MFKNIEKTENNINKFFQKFSFWSKVAFLFIFVLLIIGNVILLSLNTSVRKKLRKTKNIYQKDIERTTEQYQILSNENKKLNNEIQVLGLKLIELDNTKIELQEMIDLINQENITLFSIKDELIRGINRTNYQLENMKSSVGNIIDEKQKKLSIKEQKILY